LFELLQEVTQVAVFHGDPFVGSQRMATLV